MNTAYTENNYSNNTNLNNKSNYKDRPQSGLIPITAKMLGKLNKTENTSFEFDGIPVHDVIIMGNLVDSNQEETKIKFQIFDTTGLINVTFYDRNETDTISEISNLAEIK